MRSFGRFDVTKMKHFSPAVAMIALLFSSSCGGGNTGANDVAGGPVPATVSGTINVGTAPSAIAVDSASNKIYVTDFGTQPTFDGQGCSPSGADVRAIDAVTQQSIVSGFWFPFNPENPFAITLNASNHTLYVLAHTYWSGIGSRPVSCGPFFPRLDFFDATSLTQTHNIVGPGAGIYVNSSTGNLYVAGWMGNQVALIDLSSGGALAKIPVGTKPVGISANTTTNKIYVANSGSNDVSVIDSTTNSVVATIADPNAVAPVAVAVNPTTNTIYVANSQSNNVTVIDGTTDSVKTTIAVRTSPSGLDVDPQTNFIYVANSGSNDISVINGSTKGLQALPQTLTDPNAKNPVAVAVNPTTNKVYVANSGSNNVTVIDGAHN